MFLLWLACTTERAVPDAPIPPPNTPLSTQLAEAPVNPDGSIIGGSPTPVPVSQSPEELYKSCEPRVEGPSTPNECTKDSDCASTGCSNEVCMLATKAAEIMTTCDIQICFSVLSSCGCKEGLCSWTIAANARPMPVIFTPSELNPPQ
jgi:eight-cysteine-cluster-containing protein